MSNRKPHMEEWLRQAATQAPEITPAPVKQQAWDQLSNMLDKADGMPPLPYSPRSRWWVILLEILVLASVFTFIYLQMKFAVKPSDVNENGIIDIHQQESTAALLQNQKEHLLPFYLDSPQQRRHAVGGDLLGLNVAGNAFSGVSDLSRLNVADNTLPRATYNNHTKTNTLHGSTDQLSLNIMKKASRGAVNNKQQRSKSSTSATYWNTDPLEKNDSRQQKNRFPAHQSATSDESRSNGRKQFLSLQTPGTPEAMQTLLTKQLFIPVEDEGIKSVPAPTAMRPEKEERESRVSGFSLRIAAIAPIADAYGAALNIEYTFKWKNKWRIRPYAGAEYLTGFSKDYDHRYYGITAYHPGGGSPNGDSYDVDSIGTHFTLTGLLYGKAGVQAAYSFSKWEASAGIAYRYLLQSFGKDTFVKFSNNIPFSPSDLQPVRFNRKQVTGSGNLRIQLGLDYWISPRLQAGAVYYVQVKQPRVNSSYRPADIKLPDQTSLQVHARYFLRKR